MASSASASQGDGRSGTAASVDMAFCAVGDSPRNLITILSAFHHPGKKKKLFCNLTPSLRGIDLMWEDAKTLQAHVFLSKEMFTEYHPCRETPTTHKISLTDFLEVLQIFPTHSSGTGPMFLLGQKIGSNSLSLRCVSFPCLSLTCSAE